MANVVVPDRLVDGGGGKGGVGAIMVGSRHLIGAVPFSVATTLGLVLPVGRQNVKVCGGVTA